MGEIPPNLVNLQALRISAGTYIHTYAQMKAPNLESIKNSELKLRNLPTELNEVQLQNLLKLLFKKKFKNGPQDLETRHPIEADVNSKKRQLYVPT
jgi:hypothetical protein